MLLKKIVSKLPFGRHLIETSRTLHAWRKNNSQKSKRLRWLAQLKAQGNVIDASIDFTGRLAGYTYLDIKPAISIERDVTVWISPEPSSEPYLNLETSVFIGRNSYIGVHHKINIGAHTLIGAYSYVISANHRFESRQVPIRDQGFTGAPITIGEDVWIGTHVVVLPGVSIGRGAIVGAGSIVNRDIPEYEIWGGVPARFIKKRP